VKYRLFSGHDRGRAAFVPMMAGMMMCAVVMNGIAEVHKVRFQRCGHLLYRSDLSMSRPGSAGLGAQASLPACLPRNADCKESRQGCLRSQEAGKDACAPRANSNSARSRVDLESECFRD
jgi:hypothetical protein